ncbi:GntR family transcriptional regulator [Herbiconiux sp. KACC 21604]|uniref:GntR family transcriptional regulator n=1 Tax=unclassified Herbiconiux TaxID=2618217 RepID=UPI0014923CBF|nr:GntR family transcriptional regulator [Herbiconiux sp. SALV-R1]QJU55760.1 GntR family transcriptional regulator [Herbiconiux sp. SALV-R1]WPO86968.1 GntR family transcriptional regulator [Herbiconiux sp. KACC 21604]
MAAKYEVVLKALSASIAQMAPGDKIPTEQQLAAEFDVSSMTVRRALEALTNAKRIVGIRGKGTFVAQPAVTKRMTLASFTDSMRAAGRTARAEVLSASIGPADAELAEKFGIGEDDSVYTIERLRYGDDTPLCIDRSILPADLFPNLLGNDLAGSLYEIFRRRYDTELSRASSRVSAVLPTGKEAKLLQITTAAPCLRVIARGSTRDQRVAEITTSLYRGDLYELLIEPETSDEGAARAPR